MQCVFPDAYREKITLADHADMPLVFEIVRTASNEMKTERVTGGAWFNDVHAFEVGKDKGFMRIGGYDNAAEYGATIETEDNGRVLSIAVSEVSPYCSDADPKPAADVFIAKIKAGLKAKHLLAIGQ